MLQKRNLLFIYLPLLVISFILLGIYVSYVTVPPLDLKISLLVQKYNTTWLDKLMLAISIFGELPYSLISVLVIAAIFYYFKYKREAFFITQILFSGLVILLVKNLIDRPRPTEFYVRLVEINRFQSFPSGHVLSYVLFFGFLILLMKKLDNIPAKLRNTTHYISVFLIIGIPISRVYLGAHWFTDTLGGFILGLICLLPLSFMYLKKKRG